jgi:hypothetical protein
VSEGYQRRVSGVRRFLVLVIPKRIGWACDEVPEHVHEILLGHGAGPSRGERMQRARTHREARQTQRASQRGKRPLALFQQRQQIDGDRPACVRRPSVDHVG